MYKDWEKIFICEHEPLRMISERDYITYCDMSPETINYTMGDAEEWILFDAHEQDPILLKVLDHILKLNPWVDDVYFHLMEEKKCCVGVYDEDHITTCFYECDLYNV